MKKFALIGAAGYIAPRHMKAIKETGNELIAALDPFDSVGIIDSYFPDADFFIEPERFDRHLDKLRKSGERKVDYVAINRDGDIPNVCGGGINEADVIEALTVIHRHGKGALITRCSSHHLTTSPHNYKLILATWSLQGGGGNEGWC